MPDLTERTRRLRALLDAERLHIPPSDELLDYQLRLSKPLPKAHDDMLDSLRYAVLALPKRKETPWAWMWRNVKLGWKQWLETVRRD